MPELFHRDEPRRSRALALQGILHRRAVADFRSEAGAACAEMRRTLDASYAMKSAVHPGVPTRRVTAEWLRAALSLSLRHIVTTCWGPAVDRGVTCWNGGVDRGVMRWDGGVDRGVT